MTVKTWTDEANGDLCIIFGDENRTVFNFFTGEAREVKLGEKVHPDFILRIPWSFQGKFFEAIDMLLNQQKYKNSSRSFIEGELEATKFHLEDMRKVAKIK